jgi:hypothetical protein
MTFHKKSPLKLCQYWLCFSGDFFIRVPVDNTLTRLRAILTQTFDYQLIMNETAH